MKLDEKILQRMNELISIGDHIRHQTEGYLLNRETAYKWGTNCLSLIKRGLGEESDHYVKLYEIYHLLHVSERFSQALGIVKAAEEDFKLDMLFDTRTLIEAEVFDDFLEQSEYLLNAGYYQPAAVIAGAVLEDALRKLCIRQDIDIPGKPKADKLNADLAKSGIYNKLQQKQITALLDLRNKAAHGEWNEFEKEDVEGMLHDVRAFMMKHFS